jgi:glycosyltransferase involved in cell wall biosynthesis
MSNVLVVATATRASGALAIYKQFLSYLERHIGNDRYVVLLNKEMPTLPIPGVDYHFVDTTSYIKRIWHDNLGFKMLMKKLGFTPDKIVSLQNMGIKCYKNTPTLVYYHQSIPFFPNKWNLFYTDERILFYYKYFYPYFVKKSIGKKTVFVGQIPFITKNIVSSFHIPQERVYTLFPDVDIPNVNLVSSYPKWDDGMAHFLYPATPYRYKNHNVILEALNLIGSRELSGKAMVHFTVLPEESSSLVKTIKELDIENIVELMGVVPRDTLLSMYKSATALLFPSEVETLGLPIIEAAAFGLPIIVSNLEYAHDVIGNYEGVSFVPTKDANKWAEEIKKHLSKGICYPPLIQSNKSSWNKFFDIINQM